MSGLILGLLVGGFIAFIIGFIGAMIYEHVYSDLVEKICVISTVVLCIVSVIGITVLIIQFDRNEYSRRIITFQQTKSTIEESMNSEKLSGFERVELVNKAIDENKELLELQYDCKQWYGFNIDDSVLKLEPISFE